MKHTVECEFDHIYKCVVVMTSMGHRCGYVGIPKEHPLHGVDYSKKHQSLMTSDVVGEPIDKRGVIPLLAIEEDDRFLRPDCYFNVHGGITYSGSSEKYPVENDGLWWFGYDCAHCGDARDLSVVPEQIREIELRFPTGGVLRTKEYCVDECKSLADQFKKVADKYK